MVAIISAVITQLGLKIAFCLPGNMATWCPMTPESREADLPFVARHWMPKGLHTQTEVRLLETCSVPTMHTSLTKISWPPPKTEPDTSYLKTLSRRMKHTSSLLVSHQQSAYPGKPATRKKCKQIYWPHRDFWPWNTQTGWRKCIEGRIKTPAQRYKEAATLEDFPEFSKA